MINNPRQLWDQVLKRKYFPKSHPMHKHKTKRGISICKGLQILKNNTSWDISSGNLVRMFEDKWLHDGSFPTSSHPNPPKDVNKLMLNDRVWNEKLRHSLFDVVAVSKIKFVYISDRDHDMIRWLGNNSGDFTVKSALALISGCSTRSCDPFWRKLWKVNVIPRLSIYIFPGNSLLISYL